MVGNKSTEYLAAATYGKALMASQGLYRYLRAFSNPLRVLWTGLHNHGYPLDVRLRNGRTVRINSNLDAYLFSFCYLSKVNGENSSDIVMISDSDLVVRTGLGPYRRLIHLSGFRQEGDPSVLVSGEYDWLPAEGRTVVDIGAGAGETALYFLARGATRIIACEPFPRAFELACRNVKDNSSQSRVDIRRWAVRSLNRPIQVPLGITGTGAQALDSQDGLETESVTLDQLSSMCKGESAVLKLDCEGAEYEIISGASKSSLRNFSHIIMEFHYGRKPLLAPLEAAGFKISTTHIRSDRDSKGRPMIVGQLRAELKPSRTH